MVIWVLIAGKEPRWRHAGQRGGANVAPCDHPSTWVNVAADQYTVLIACSGSVMLMAFEVAFGGLPDKMVSRTPVGLSRAAHLRSREQRLTMI